MITPDGDAKMLDLGLARAMGEESPLTRPNVVIGTLDYASPEQLSDAARADGAATCTPSAARSTSPSPAHPPFEGGDVVNKIYKQRDGGPRAAGRVGAGRAGRVRGDRSQADGQGPGRSLPVGPRTSQTTWHAGPTRIASRRSWAPRPSRPGRSGPHLRISTTTISASSTTSRSPRSARSRFVTWGTPNPASPRCTSPRPHPGRLCSSPRASPSTTSSP